MAAPDEECPVAGTEDGGDPTRHRITRREKVTTQRNCVDALFPESEPRGFLRCRAGLRGTPALFWGPGAVALTPSVAVPGDGDPRVVTKAERSRRVGP